MEKILELKTIEPASLLGVGDAHLKLIEEALPATLVVRGEVIKINGEKTIVEQVHEILHEMMTTLGSKGSLSSRDVQKLITLVQSANGHAGTTPVPPDRVIHYGRKGAIVPKTTGQERYADLVMKNDIVFSVGPAGTGKTFLAVAFAVAALESHEADRIVLCRPAVEAGESLGFLPGDLKEKVDPYLAPLYDALSYMLPQNKMRTLLENKTIERVSNFVYLGADFNEFGDDLSDIQGRRTLANAKLAEMRGVMRNKYTTRRLKVKMMMSFIYPSIGYCSETWALGPAERHHFDVWWMSEIRKIRGVRQYPDMLRNQQILEDLKASELSNLTG